MQACILWSGSPLLVLISPLESAASLTLSFWPSPPLLFTPSGINLYSHLRKLYNDKYLPLHSAEGFSCILEQGSNSSWLEHLGRSGRREEDVQDWFLYCHQELRWREWWLISGQRLTVLLTYFWSKHALSLLSWRSSMSVFPSTPTSAHSGHVTQDCHQNQPRPLLVKRTISTWPPIFPRDSVSGRCYKLKLSFVAAAPRTSETELHAWSSGNEEAAHQRLCQSPLLPPEMWLLAEKSCFISHEKKFFFPLACLPGAHHLNITQPLH